MKKYLLLICLALCVVTTWGREPEKGYRGFVDIEFLTGKGYYFDGSDGWHKRSTVGSLGLSTTHGYQINNHLFVGAGVEVANWFWFGMLPIYADARYDVKWGKFTPFADVRLGYDCLNHKAYFSPNIGYRFNWGRKINLNLGLGLTLKGYDKSDLPYGVNANTYDPFFNLRFGIDF